MGSEPLPGSSSLNSFCFLLLLNMTSIFNGLLLGVPNTRAVSHLTRRSESNPGLLQRAHVLLTAKHLPSSPNKLACEPQNMDHFHYFVFFKFYFICMSVSHACMSLHHLCAWCLLPEGGIRAPELSHIQMAVNHHISWCS